MSTIYTLVEVEPLDPATGERVTIRAGMANLRTDPERDMLGLGGTVWEPALSKAPEMALRLFNGDFATPVSPGAATLPLRLEVLRETWPGIDGYDWGGAAVSIYAGKAGEPWPWALFFAGAVSSFDGEANELSLTAEVDTEPFDADMLVNTYAGTSDAEGGEDLKDKVKPLVIGWARNVEPVLIDAVDNVYQFSGYGGIEEVTELFERGSSFGSPVANYSSYNNLVAATVANGKYATCLAEGLIRLGAPAAGLITGDIKGHAVDGATPRFTGAIVEALAGIAGVSTDLIEPGTLDGLDRDRPMNAALVLTSQQSFLDTVKALALPLNRQAGVGFGGKLFITAPLLEGPEYLTLHTGGAAEPQVIGDPKEMNTSAPFSKTVMGAERNWRVQSTDEIAFTAELIDKGDYNGSQTYREGNYVTLPNGAKYLYINATPSSGHEPPNATYWELMSGGIDGVVTNIIYKESATQPSTPANSSGVPATWVDDYGSLAGSGLPVWACFGTKASGETDYVWSTPYPMLADLRTYDAINDDGTIADDTVDTPAIMANAIGEVNTTSWSDTAVGAGATVTIGTTGTITVGDSTDGKAFVVVFCEIDGGSSIEVGAQGYLDIDPGSGTFTQQATCRTGVRTSGADSYMKAALVFAVAVGSVQTIKVRLRVQSITMPGAGGANSFTVRAPQVAVIGSSR